MALRCYGPHVAILLGDYISFGHLGLVLSLQVLDCLDHELVSQGTVALLGLQELVWWN